MAITLELLREYMDAEGMRYLVDPNRPVLFFGVSGVAGSYQVLLILELDGQFLQFRTMRYKTCPAGDPRVGLLHTVLAELNGRSRFVKYAWDPSDGEVIAYGDHWIMDGTLTLEQFRRMMGNFLPVLDQNNRRISQVVEKGVDPGAQDFADLLRSLESTGDLDEALRDLLTKLSGDKPPDGPGEIRV